VPECAEHWWQKVPVVVVVVNDPLEDAKGGQTYNAECATCGERAWLHWRTPLAARRTDLHLRERKSRSQRRHRRKSHDAL
jgi:hypothetical protein